MVSLKDLKKFKSVDIEQFDGVKSTIEKIYVDQPREFTHNNETKTVVNLIVETANLNTEDDKVITAKEYIGLYEQDGALGHSTAPTSKAYKMLKHFKIENFEELVGKECLVVRRVKQNDRVVLGIHHS